MNKLVACDEDTRKEVKCVCVFEMLVSSAGLEVRKSSYSNSLSVLLSASILALTARTWKRRQQLRQNFVREMQLLYLCSFRVTLLIIFFHAC